MDEKIENSGEESDNDSILDLDLNPDGVIRPFMFEPQHNSSSGEEEISVDEETQEEIEEETSTRSRLGCQEMNVLGDTYQTLSSAPRTFVFLGSRCTPPLTPRNAHALRCEFSKWRTGQRGK